MKTVTYECACTSQIPECQERTYSTAVHFFAGLGEDKMLPAGQRRFPCPLPPAEAVQAGLGAGAGGGPEPELPDARGARGLPQERPPAPTVLLHGA